ncbi:unnamed protein product [Rotaria sordida]|uniref:Uncharacterized protein n=1 Tax=Rotaria sordida TaxID=392033 RepID=A0A814M014_9BILA|nr:unnamed protein product [Rotaria sordida]CAF1253852.1 unnamed protein product [Rotaria sordida]
MLKQILCQIFSNQCQLTFLQLDIANLSYEIHQSLNSRSYVSTNKISNDFQTYSITLRHLHIHLNHICFLEHLIEYVPNLEQLSIHFLNSLLDKYYLDSKINIPKLSNENWFNKMPKLKYFILKSFIDNDFEFIYLKWLLNNLNYITKLQIYLYSGYIWKENQLIWKSVIDANFIRRYCLPDQIINLKYFYFYICAQRQSSLNNISEIINSFKINSFFILHQWTNVQCFYDENRSDQHIFSSNLKKFQRSILLFKYPYIYEWSDIEYIQNNIHPSFYVFLKQFNKLCPNTCSMTIDIGSYEVKSKILESLTTSFEMREQNLNNSQLRNITKLKFGYFSGRRIRPYLEWTYKDRQHLKILTLLISIPVQLKYIFVQKFEWLFYAIEFNSYYLREDALDTVRYAEFGISSCNIGPDNSAHIGKDLIPFLNTYMPYLQTLRLWRPDDFPWTSIRPICESDKLFRKLMAKWRRTLCTPESINEHVIVFEKDLCQLVEQLKEFVYLDIYGRIGPEKVKLYHSMVQKRFPNSRIYIQISRFSLWI